MRRLTTLERKPAKLPLTVHADPEIHRRLDELIPRIVARARRAVGDRELLTITRADVLRTLLVRGLRQMEDEVQAPLDALHAETPELQRRRHAPQRGEAESGEPTP